MRSHYRLGIDAGGTFTDFVLADKSSDVKIYKTPSTPNDPTKAIENGLALISEDLEVSPEDIVSQSDLCINGTTVGLNALIQHKGSLVGLICTKGHEDSIEIRLGHKEDGYRYDPDYPPAVMLAPRYLRRGIRERVISNGTIKTPMNEHDVREACKLFIDNDIKTIAVSFIWSVLNPSHEIRAAQIVKEMMPDAIITIGSELYPQIREYTRTSTAITNAYLSPILRNYVSAVNEYFIGLGGKNNVRYFQSNGGLATGKVMSDRSVYAINSGPASAPQAGLSVCNPFDYKNVITVDMGGTSFDITLTKDGNTNLNKNIDFLRYRIGIPMIQVETLGAGGGSIGWIDEMGLLQVGPQSAGADPGPACYDKGGIQPTTTDAAFYLGMLGEGKLASGLQLNKSLAEQALNSVGSQIGMSAFDAAKGILKIGSANMADAIREITIEQGIDPRELKLLAFGGAGPLMSNLIANELDIKEIIVPPYSGNFSAWGLLGADLLQMNARTKILRLSDEAISECNDILKELFKELEQRQKIDFSTSSQIKEIALDMRWMGQEHTITLKLEDGKDGNISMDTETLKNKFMEEYQKTFGSKLDTIIEIVSTRASLRVQLPRKSESGKIDEVGIEVSNSQIECYSFTEDKKIQFDLVARSKIDSKVSGPLIIIESTAITYVDINYDVDKDSNGNLILVNREIG